MNSFILIASIAGLLVLFCLSALCLYPFRSWVAKFSKRMQEKEDKSDWEHGFMSAMRLYYIEKKTILEIQDFYSEIDRIDFPFFFKGMDEAFVKIKGCQND